MYVGLVVLHFSHATQLCRITQNAPYVACCFCQSTRSVCLNFFKNKRMQEGCSSSLQRLTPSFEEHGSCTVFFIHKRFTKLLLWRFILLAYT